MPSRKGELFSAFQRGGDIAMSNDTAHEVAIWKIPDTLVTVGGPQRKALLKKLRRHLRNEMSETEAVRQVEAWTTANRLPALPATRVRRKP